MKQTQTAPTITQPLPLTLRPSLEQFLTVRERKGAKLLKRAKQGDKSQSHHQDAYRLSDGQRVSVEYTKRGKRYLGVTLRGYSRRIQA